MTKQQEIANPNALQECDVRCVPSVEEAYAMGAKGGATIEAERLAFEEWVRGHCWTLGAKWNGKYYLGENETGSYVCPLAMQTRMMWAAWRDRAALVPNKEYNT